VPTSVEVYLLVCRKCALFACKKCKQSQNREFTISDKPIGFRESFPFLKIILRNPRRKKEMKKESVLCLLVKDILRVTGDWLMQ